MDRLKFVLAIMLSLFVALPAGAGPLPPPQRPRAPADKWCFSAWITTAQPSGLEVTWDVRCGERCVLALGVASTAEGALANLQPWMSLWGRSDPHPNPLGTGTQRWLWPRGVPRPGDVACLQVQCTVSAGTLASAHCRMVSPDDRWTDHCTQARLEVTGVGMEGVTAATATLEDPDAVDWLVVQVSGRPPVPDNVVLVTAQQEIVLAVPTSTTAAGWTFATSMHPAAQIQATVGGPAEGVRGLVLYARRQAPASYTSVGETINAFLHHASHVVTVTIPPVKALSTVYVHGVIIDNNDDDRTVTFGAEAGGVAASVTTAAPNRGPGLSILSVELLAVPEGTDQVHVIFTSPEGTGDSFVAVGYNVSYPCLEPVAQ